MPRLLPFILALLFISITLCSSADQVDKEKKEENPEVVVEVAGWPEDLETSSQIVFRPLFVYKQRKAELLLEQKRRKAEVEAESSEEVDFTKTVTWHLRPPPPDYQAYWYHYRQQSGHPQYYYSPYNYYYNRYPYTSWHN